MSRPSLFGVSCAILDQGTHVPVVQQESSYDIGTQIQSEFDAAKRVKIAASSQSPRAFQLNLLDSSSPVRLHLSYVRLPLLAPIADSMLATDQYGIQFASTHAWTVNAHMHHTCSYSRVLPGFYGILNVVGGFTLKTITRSKVRRQARMNNHAKSSAVQHTRTRQVRVDIVPRFEHLPYDVHGKS